MRGYQALTLVNYAPPLAYSYLHATDHTANSGELYDLRLRPHRRVGHRCVTGKPGLQAHVRKA
jgi:hypothetical protein